MRSIPRSHRRAALAAVLAFVSLTGAVRAAPPDAAAAARTLENEPDPGKKTRAAEHVHVATIAFEKQNYALAITELRAAYDEVPDPSFLYALGQAYRVSGDCARAKDAFRAFLDTNPSQKHREAALANIERCTPAPPPSTPRAAKAAPAASPPPPAASTAVTPEPASTRQKTWYLDVPGGALTGAGVVAAVVGTVLYAGGRSRVSDADAVRDDGAFANNRDEADGGLAQQRVGLVVMGAGAALVTAGVLRYVGVAKQTRTGTLQVAPAFGGLVAAGAF